MCVHANIHMHVHVSLAAAMTMVSKFVCREESPTQLLKFDAVDNMIADLIYKLWE